MAPVHMIDFRRALIRFSATLVGLIVVMGLLSLFSTWSMNRAYARGDAAIEQIRELATEAQQAQIDFKVQVQEWKNILLRGEDPAAREHYTRAFEKREAAVEGHLRNLAAKSHDLGLPEYQTATLQLIDSHRGLGQSYRQALSRVEVLDPASARAVDKSVMGIDRELESRINTLSQEMYALNLLRRDALIGQLAERYRTLRRALLIFMSFALAMTGVSLFTALRATRA